MLSFQMTRMGSHDKGWADGTVAEVTVKPGDQIDAKDLLVRFE